MLSMVNSIKINKANKRMDLLINYIHQIQPVVCFLSPKNENVFIQIYTVLIKQLELTGASIFIESEPTNNFLINLFNQNKNIFHLQPYRILNSANKNDILNLLAKKINSLNNPTVLFTKSILCNSLLPLLHNDVNCFELVDVNDTKKETQSTAKSNKIITSIVFSQYESDQLKILKKDTYQKNIKNNSIEIFNYPIKKISSISNKLNPFILKVLFVGFNSKNYRPEYIFEIAQRAYKLNYNIQFKIVGNFNLENITLTPNIQLVNIDLAESIDNLYAENDCLLYCSWPLTSAINIIQAMAYGIVPISNSPLGIIDENVNIGIMINDKTQTYLPKTEFILEDRNPRISNKSKEIKGWLPHNFFLKFSDDENQTIENYLQVLYELASNVKRLNTLRGAAFAYSNQYQSTKSIELHLNEFINSKHIFK